MITIVILYVQGSKITAENKQAIFDLHVHSTYSDGTMSLYRIANYVDENDNLVLVGITDHCSHRSYGRKMLDQGTAIERKQKIEELNRKSKTSILNCIEGDILPRGKVRLPKGLGKKFFDLVVGSIHRPLNPITWTETVKGVIRNNKIDVLGHPMAYNDIMRDSIEEIMLKLSRKNIAVELNTKYKFPPNYFLDLLKKYNVKVVPASDAHSLFEIGKVQKGIELTSAKELNLMTPSHLQESLH